MILVVVDYQYDFLPHTMTSALPVPGGWDILDEIAKLARKADFVIATRDWHPINHSSFKIFGGQWPVHCVAGSKGAEIAHTIDAYADVVISKGTNILKPGYSATENPAFIPILTSSLRLDKKIVVCGLALDYCVGLTALGIADHGFENVTVPGNATKGINLKTINLMLLKLEKHGVKYERAY